MLAALLGSGGTAPSTVLDSYPIVPVSEDEHGSRVKCDSTPLLSLSFFFTTDTTKSLWYYYITTILTAWAFSPWNRGQAAMRISYSVSDYDRLGSLPQALRWCRITHSHGYDGDNKGDRTRLKKRPETQQGWRIIPGS